MQKSLQYISVSHHTAPVDIREQFHFSEQEVQNLLTAIPSQFPDITGLIILSTCNRSEIYFEACETSIEQVISYWLKKKGLETDSSYLQYMQFSANTYDAAHHLLSVGSGLHSLIKGDAQIITQVKAAFSLSRSYQLQGTLLERVMQAVFRMHKRIANETNFRSGSASTAYQALKAIRQQFGGQLHDKRLLIVGAGEIGREVAQYVSKFVFGEVYIANRHEARAEAVAQEHQLQVSSWQQVVDNDLIEFDAIITAVSNYPDLIGASAVLSDKKVILVDLGMPSNINAQLAYQENIRLVNLDRLTDETENSLRTRDGSTLLVEDIIREELREVMMWYRKMPARALLKNYAHTIREAVVCELHTNSSVAFDEETIEQIADRISKKLVKHPARAIQTLASQEAETDYVKMMTQILGNNQRVSA